MFSAKVEDNLCFVLNKVCHSEIILLEKSETAGIQKKKKKKHHKKKHAVNIYALDIDRLETDCSLIVTEGRAPGSAPPLNIDMQGRF